MDGVLQAGKRASISERILPVTWYHSSASFSVEAMCLGTPSAHYIPGCVGSLGVRAT